MDDDPIDQRCSFQELQVLVEEQCNADTDDASKLGWFPNFDNYKGDGEIPAGIIMLATEPAIDETGGFGALDFDDPGWCI